MDNFNPALTLKLSIQRALLGEVSDRLVSLTCGLKGCHIELRGYFSLKPTEEDIGQLQCVGAEVIADFPDGYTIEEKWASAEECEPQMLDFWAFMRRLDGK
jgi:hypothetical protein